MSMNLYLGTDEGLAVFEGQEEEWRPRQLRLQDREITAVAAAGKLLWAGTPDGLWHSANGGITWLPTAKGLGARHVRALAVRPDAPKTVLMGTEPANILISRDGGDSWEECPDVTRLRDEHGWSLPYSPEAGCIRGFGLAGSRIYAAAEVGGVLRSDDAGRTWRLLDGDVHPDVHELALHHSDVDIVYAATGGGRYCTHDGGVTWGYIGDGYTRAIWTDAERPGVVLAGPARYVGAMGRIERSIDGGDSWMLASDGFDIPMSNMVERFVAAGSHVLAITSDGLLYTAKRGIWIWHSLDLGVAAIRAVAFSEV
jgi:photosystem II stability/assembly factor-like uncharacterized protein